MNEKELEERLRKNINEKNKNIEKEKNEVKKMKKSLLVETLKKSKEVIDCLEEKYKDKPNFTRDFYTSLDEYVEKKCEKLDDDITISSDMAKKTTITSTNDYEMVNHPQHYNNYDIEVIDMMERIWGTYATATFCEMNAFKYRMRMGTKPNQSIEQDLEKEQWCLKKAKELSSVNVNECSSSFSKVNN